MKIQTEMLTSKLSALLASKPFLITAYTLMFLTVLIPIVGSYFNMIDVDSAILLVEMERIAEGYIPYKTLHLNYPPLWYYTNAALKFLFHVPYCCYHFYLTVHWLFVIGCALLVMYISKAFYHTSQNTCFQKLLSVFVTWCFLITTHWLQGNMVLFELPSIFWGLLAISLCIKWKNSHPALFILIGIFACNAFLTKQFGAGFFMLVLWLIITSPDKNKAKQLAMYLLGYLLPLALCFAYWGVDIFNSILFNGYGTDAMDEYWGRETTISDKIIRICRNLLYFCNRIAPHTYVALALLPLMFKQHKYREALLCFFAIGGFILQYHFVHGGLHYYLYLVPFALLLIPILFSLNLHNFSRIVLPLSVAAVVFFSLYSTYHNRVWKLYMHAGRENYHSQQRFSEKLSKLIHADKTIFIPHGGIIYLYYTANLYPPNMAEIGYAVGPMEICIPACARQVHDADYVLHYSEKMMRQIYPDGWDYEYFYNDSIKQIVDSYPSDTIDADGNIVLHHISHP